MEDLILFLLEGVLQLPDKKMDAKEMRVFEGRDYLQSRLEFLKERMHHRGMAKGAEGKG